MPRRKAVALFDGRVMGLSAVALAMIDVGLRG